MCKELILTWQSPENRQWFVVGKLKKEDNIYQFSYTYGALNAKKYGFLGFSGMNDINETYSSKVLFPIFQNRILNKSRPERVDFLEWLNVKDDQDSDFEELAKTGGIRITDNVQLYPVPQNKNGFYEVEFFSHGLRHLAPHFHDRVDRLKQGERLYLCADKQNEQDQDALILRTQDPVEFVGYCPKFFAHDFKTLLDKEPTPLVSVVKVNTSAPEQLKLLCSFKAPWPNDFKPFNTKDYKLIES